MENLIRDKKKRCDTIIYTLGKRGIISQTILANLANHYCWHVDIVDDNSAGL